jgi:formamidopyrimidine-DNA glycosylase
MPEMPEVQAHCERMTAALAGATLTGFRLINFAGLKTFDPPADAAVGATLVSVDRHAKYMIMRFDNDVSHVVHLMQGGRLRPDEKQSKKPRGGIARWVFEGPRGEQAWLLTEAGTERKAGIWAVRGQPIGQEPLTDLGPDPTTIGLDEFAAAIGAHSRRLHGVLRTQGVIAGLGRMLANEILFDAGLSPFANAARISDEEMAQLFESTQRVVAAATEHERTLDDIGKSVDRPSKVHNRSGEPCLGRGDAGPCGDTVHTVEYRKYTVFYCPTEQTGGKVLADNTTSKFLK